MSDCERIVTALPLSELWDDDGPVPGRPVRLLSGDDLCDLLRQGPLKLVVAHIGSELHWLSEGACFAFWKIEVRPRVADPDESICLEDFPDEYCYAASEWSLDSGARAVVLEKHD